MDPKTRMDIHNLLKAGYGVEDIAVKLDLEPPRIRFEIARLRATGKLTEFFSTNN